MTNPTMDKFGYPATLLLELKHWVVMLRPAQVTLGSLVLASKSTATAYGDLPPEAFAEQGEAVKAIERVLRSFVGYERINYLMLMMVDPNVHFHVIPRYLGTREWDGAVYPDAGWPGPPQLGSALSLTDDQVASLCTELRNRFA